MIEWKKYDKENPPTFDKNYPATDGTYIIIADLQQFDDCTNKWVRDNGVHWDGITHYAEINLPIL